MIPTKTEVDECVAAFDYACEVCGSHEDETVEISRKTATEISKILRAYKEATEVKRPEPVQRYRHAGDRMISADGAEALFLCSNLEYVWASDYDALLAVHNRTAAERDSLRKMNAAAETTLQITSIRAENSERQLAEVQAKHDALAARLRQWAGNRDMKRIFPVVSADLERIADTLTAPQQEPKNILLEAHRARMQPQQEPVAIATATVSPQHPKTVSWIKCLAEIPMGTKLYTAPQPKYEVKHRTANAEERKVYDAIAANYHAPQQEPVACCCGEPLTLGVVHRKENPCFYWQDTAPSSGVREPDAAHLQTIDERDAAEEAVSDIYYRITGRSPEWSNLFGFEQAIDEIQDAFDLVRAVAKSNTAPQSGVREGMLRAPWPDFLGQPIYHGDRMSHPDGNEFVAIRLGTDDDSWRAVYGEDGAICRLSLQVGSKGQAFVITRAAEQVKAEGKV